MALNVWTDGLAALRYLLVGRCEHEKDARCHYCGERATERNNVPGSSQFVVITINHDQSSCVT